MVATWLLLQVTDVLGQILELPEAVGRIVLFVLAIGFVPVLLFSWVYELTPEGVKKESELDSERSITHHTARKLDYATIGLLITAIIFVAINKNYSDPAPPPDNSHTENTTPAVSVQDSDPAAEEKSIAVLAFRDMSAAGDQDYFAEGIAEELLNALVRVKGLRVASRTSAFSFKGQNLELPVIAERLNVNHILEGSVRTGNDRIRVTAQLIDVKTDTHVWSETYDRSAEDILAVQDEITSKVVAELKVQLSADNELPSVAEKLSGNSEAYRLYLRGRHLWRSRDLDSMLTAKKLFEQAIELDPGFSRAWSNLAVVAKNLASYDAYGPVAEYMSTSTMATNQALALDPQNSEALSVRADSLDSQCRYIESDKNYQAAIEADPGDPTPRHWYALMLMNVGQTRRAGEQSAFGLELDSMISALHATRGNYHMHNNDPEQAINSYKIAKQLGLYGGGPFMEAATLVWTGEYEKASPLMAEGALSYGFNSTDWIPGFIEALQTGQGKEEIAADLAARFDSGAEEAVKIAELLGMLNSPLYFRVNGPGLCGKNMNFAMELWFPGAQALRNHPDFLPYVQSMNMLAYFREFGWPDVCTNENPEVEGCH
jgi:TolB-like protein